MPGWLDTEPDADRRADAMVDIHLVGNYAVAPAWADGHHTGYYTFTLLARTAARARSARRSGRPGSVATTTRRGLDDRRHHPVHRRPSDRRDEGPDVRARRPQPWLLGNLIAGLRSLGGGEIHEYTSLLEDTRRQALDRLVKNATLMGGNAVVSMRFDSSELAGTMSEIVAYGTAVVVEPDANAPQPPTE
jgi:uncharacterized protein YbjQ (UPF0145 family)